MFAGAGLGHLTSESVLWQRAVNRQPGSRARTRRAGALYFAFFLKFSIFPKNLKIGTLMENFMRIEL